MDWEIAGDSPLEPSVQYTDIIKSIQWYCIKRIYSLSTYTQIVCVCVWGVPLRWCYLVSLDLRGYAQMDISSNGQIRVEGNTQVHLTLQWYLQNSYFLPNVPN